MRKCALCLLALIMILGCNNKNSPDVSHVQVVLEVQRFDRDFFMMDTTSMSQSLEKLHTKYPGFLQDFVFNILALPPQNDSTAAVEEGIKSFIKSYKQVYDSAALLYRNVQTVEADVKQGLKYVKHYFPEYKLPTKLVTFVGPIDSYGNILTTDALAVGLQMYMGSNYSIYLSEAGQQLYPAYISRRFTQDYIVVNCMKNIVDDMYPDNQASRPLIEQMVESGKRLYLLDHILPGVADTLKSGYTKNQLDGAYKNEQNIWSFFVQADLLFSIDPAITKDYMNDGPKTTALGEASPGFIGQFVGWQIVKKWMGKNENKSLAELMRTNPKQIFEQAKYKP